MQHSPRDDAEVQVSRAGERAALHIDDIDRCDLEVRAKLFGEVVTPHRPKPEDLTLDLAGEGENGLEVTGAKEQIAALDGEANSSEQRLVSQPVLVRVLGAPRVSTVRGPRQGDIGRQRHPREAYAELRGQAIADVCRDESRQPGGRGLDVAAARRSLRDAARRRSSPAGR